MNRPKNLFVGSEEFAANTDPALVLIEISKDSITTGNISSVLERLHTLTDSEEKARLYQESVAFYVNGYDSDSRELVEIQEVRAFFQKLTDQWPHWCWYLCRGSGALGLLMALICKVRVIRSKNGFGTQFEDSREVADKLSDMLSRSGALFRAYSISQEEAEESALSATRELMS